MTTAIESTTELERFRSGVPGIYPTIPAAEYHALRAISSTALKRLYTGSPRHALAVLNNPDLVGGDEIDIGGASHAMLLTPEEFDSQYVLADQCEATVKSTGARCENSGVKLTADGWRCGVHGKGMADLATAEVLTVDNYRRAKGIHDAVWENRNARRILKHATDRELTVLWVEEGEQGKLLCKARFDLLCRKQGILPDLKTCRCAKPEAFCSQAWKLGYQLQLAHYLHGAAVAGIAADIPVIIAVENDDPFDVVVFEPTRRLLDEGHAARREAMATLLECERTGIWPGYAEQTVMLDMPEWAQRQTLNV